MEGQTDSIEVPVEEKGLVGVEGETLDEVATIRGAWTNHELFSNSAGDDFIGFRGRVWSDKPVEGEDLFEEGVECLSVGIDDNSGDDREPEPVDILVVVEVLLFVVVDD